MERQAFIIAGEAWKHKKINPLSNLKVADLRKELSVRGIAVDGKKNKQLQEELDNLQNGISNVPALLQNTPQASLASLNIQSYEVLPSEPLHDLKGHFHNIIEECLAAAPSTVKRIVTEVKKGMLNKSTLRGSDYRRAIILIYKHLQTTDMEDYIELFSTAVNIASLLYSNDSERTPTNALRLHNANFIHAMLCTQLFGSTHRTTTLFGRYFHSIVCHAPLIYRIISLRSVNTETQERMFNQMKQITKGTSNQKTNYVISNILIRLQEEAKCKSSDPLKAQESEVKRLAKGLEKSNNSVIPFSWIQKFPTHYQAHLERISDFLLLGKDVWWTQTLQGVEFLDGEINPGSNENRPTLLHFRSATLSNVDTHLQACWEKCIDERVQLPAFTIRVYTTCDGNQISLLHHTCLLTLVGGPHPPSNRLTTTRSLVGGPHPPSNRLTTTRSLVGGPHPPFNSISRQHSKVIAHRTIIF